MVKVAEVNIDIDLSLFSRWLNSQRVLHRISEENGLQVIWVEDPQADQPVKDALERYLSDQAFKAQLDSYSEQLTFSLRPARSLMPRPKPAQAPIIFTFIGLAVLVALLTGFGGGGPILRTMMIVDPIGLDISSLPARLNLLLATLGEWQVWRLISPDFLHFSEMHLIFNMLMFWFLGGQIEGVQGRQRFIGLFLVCSIVPNIAQYLEAGPLFGGMSGVVYGLVGYCWLWCRMRPGELMFPPALMGISLVWLIIGYTPLTEALMIGRMANSAHLFGLLMGLLYAYILLSISSRKTA
ncbi:rhomboid family intramembrane serine protease [Alkalimarinus sediminis]|uniref:Rhomboid family intramembrane serine protease n=1 Tax=Alkalimarinus sediminis TaxID=1632866 RepID=A0A9E8HJT1_9ALTE|nr:rhomboid family intramembrane serine protease [Alkalimarinus sediminis]UZW75714.1 rhomboid family intramembrane serine protease [Alkalimarinus sediminis]